ncbi:hypothetical protein WA158_008438 [Blastocystis sp. Blastoise]
MSEGAFRLLNFKEKSNYSVEELNQIKKDLCESLRSQLIMTKLSIDIIKRNCQRTKGNQYLLSKQMMKYFDKEYSPAINKALNLIEESDDNIMNTINKNKEDFINFDKCFDKMLDYQSRISKYFH